MHSKLIYFYYLANNPPCELASTRPGLSLGKLLFKSLPIPEISPDKWSSTNHRTFVLSPFIYPPAVSVAHSRTDTSIAPSPQCILDSGDEV